MSANEQTRAFHDFERVAIAPARLSDGALLTTFRAANKFATLTLLDEGSDSRRVQGMVETVNTLGEALRLRWPPEARKKR